MSDTTPSGNSLTALNVLPGRIVVVGPCAAGKTTLVNALCALGYDAHACGQEHSEIAALWRHTQPNVLIALKANLRAVRRRRAKDWPAWLHNVQLRRLTNAFASADLVIDTSAQDREAVLGAAVSYLEHHSQGGA